MKKELYQSPAVEVLELNPEGVLCSSLSSPAGTEGLDENEGAW